MTANRDSDPIIYGIEHSDKAHSTPYPDGETHFAPDGYHVHQGPAPTNAMVMGRAANTCQECATWELNGSDPNKLPHGWSDDKTPFGATLTNTSAPLARKLAPMLSDFEKATDALTPEDFG